MWMEIGELERAFMEWNRCAFLFFLIKSFFIKRKKAEFVLLHWMHAKHDAPVLAFSALVKLVAVLSRCAW